MNIEQTGSLPLPNASSNPGPSRTQAAGRDLRGGLATLLGSLCIAALVPAILNAGDAASPITSVAATALACIVGTTLFAVLTRLPFAIGPGIVPASIMASYLASGIPFSTVLGIELIAGLAFAALVALGWVGQGVRRMPPALKTAGEIAIGLYLLLAALRAAGVMHADVAGTPLLGGGALAFLAGLAVVFLLRRHRTLGGYATLIGVIVAAAAYGFTGQATLPDRAWEWPTLQWHAPDLAAAFDWRYVDEIAILLYVVVVDVVATLETLARCEPELQGKDGNLRNFDQALRASAAVFVLSPFLGTAPMLVFFESLGGVLSGARTALASAVVVIGFTLVLFCSPLAVAVPAGACAVALAFIGCSITEHAVQGLRPAGGDAGATRLATHLAIAALLLVIVFNTLAVALFALFLLYPLLAHGAGLKPRTGEVLASLAAGGLLVTMLV